MLQRDNRERGWSLLWHELCVHACITCLPPTPFQESLNPSKTLTLSFHPLSFLSAPHSMIVSPFSSSARPLLSSRFLRDCLCAQRSSAENGALKDGPTMKSNRRLATNEMMRAGGRNVHSIRSQELNLKEHVFDGPLVSPLCSLQVS